MELNQFRDVDVVLDKANDNIIQKQFVSAGDKDGRSLTVQITENGVIGEVAGATLNLYWHNQASGLTDLSAFYVVDRATSVFKIDYPQNMLTPGKVIAYIQILHGGKVTHTKPFEITVQKLAGTTRGVLATAEYGALVTTLAKANEFEINIAKKADKAEVNAQLAQIAQETNGKKIKQIGFAVRNDGTGFKFIEDSQHTPLNGVSIEHMPDDFSLKINYGFTAKKVITLVATTDETFAQMGVTVGASVGLDFSILKFGKQDNVFGYMTKSGGDNPIFTIDPQFSNGVKSATWNAYRGSLQITHDKCNNSVPYCSTRNPLTVAYPSSLNRRSSGFTSSEFRFKNDGDTDVQAIPPDGTVFIFGYSGFFQISLDQLNYEGSNVWIYGIMEVE